MKNHCKDLLHDKNYPHGIILVHMLRLKQENLFRWNHKSKILSHCLTHYLTTFTSLDAKQSIVQLQFYATTTNVPVRCLLGFRRVWGLFALLFILSSIRLFLFFMQQNHINVLIFPINIYFPRAVYLDTTTSILKCLRYSREIWTSTDMIL